MVYSSWDIEHDRLKLVILGHFLPFYKKELKKSKFWKNEKNCWRYHHYSVYQKSQSYDLRFRDTDWDRPNCFVILGHFCPFTPLMIAKIKFLKRWRKIPGDITTLYMCTINKIMMYGSWDMECDGDNFFIILDYFLLFYPSNDLKNQNF